MARPVIAAGGLLAAVAVFVVLLSAGRAGAQVFNIDAQPDEATNVVGTDHTVTASVDVDGTPTGGSYTFEITDGPNEGTTSSGPSFTYTGSGGTGTDTILVCYLFEFCDTVYKTWVEPSPTPTPSPVPTPSPTAAAPSDVEPSPESLPETGSEPEDGGSPGAMAFGLAVAALAAIGAAVLAVRLRRR